MLEKVAHVNDLSDKFREELEAKINGFGKQVRYRFNISHPDPHPDNKGMVVWPSVFKLGPIKYDIKDPHDPKKRKQIALVKEVDEKGLPNAYYRIQVTERNEGILRLNLDKDHDRDVCAVMELHPKFDGGQFQDKTLPPVFVRVDEQKDARRTREDRKTRINAMRVAADYNDGEVKDFACAMNWDENEDLDILRNKVEEMADKEPLRFTALVDDAGTFEYMANVKRAFDRQIIIFIPVENRVIWGANQQTIAILDRVEGTDKNNVQRLTDWITYNPEKGKQVYTQIKVLLQ